ncbi:MAG: hypothetical protein KF740_03515 [Ramlibacter sp.]|nr:hypothetical protein [Ramlibacter sp.]
MRRWFLIVMIALLPLRVWAGDVMASQMLMQQLNAINTVANNGHPKRASVALDSEMAATPHADCAGHGSAAGPGDDAPAGMDCSTCVACQVCHSLALMALPAPQATSGAWHHAPAGGALAYSSAPVALGFKPPIS